MCCALLIPQMHSNVKLQIAAIFCISNLVWREEAGSSERQARLRDLGVYKLLQQLIMTSDTLLFDKYVYMSSGKANNSSVT
jgi:hypothetical protein